MTARSERFSTMRWAALMAGVALTIAACGTSSSPTGDGAASPQGAAAPGTATTSMPEMDHHGTTHTSGAAEGSHMSGLIAATATGESPCEKSGDPFSPGQAADGMSERGMVKQEPLDKQARTELQAQQILAREAAAKYPTVADAEKAGYHRSTEYLTCIGTHYTNVALVLKFDPAAPSELLFDGTEPDSRLVGLSYLVYNPGGAPEGFAGPNDHWHQHNSNGGLCLKGSLVVASENSSPEECKAAGGKKTELTDVWMMHDWVVPGWECSWGTFASECPELGGKTGASAWES